MNSISLLLSSALQLVIFSLIPFIWWLVTARKEVNFFYWIGLIKPKTDNIYHLLVLFILSFLLLIAPSFIILLFVNVDELATSQFAGYGISALVPVLLYSFIQTGLSEEIFFRGFLTKRLSSKLGFATGNLIQGLIFGALHGVLFFFVTDLINAIAVIAFTSSVGWLLGFVNEKKAGGSIIPSWILHSISNLIISALTMFSII